MVVYVEAGEHAQVPTLRAGGLPCMFAARESAGGVLLWLPLVPPARWFEGNNK